jgi:hypothetical protein
MEEHNRRRRLMEAHRRKQLFLCKEEQGGGDIPDIEIPTTSTQKRDSSKEENHVAGRRTEEKDEGT